MTASGMGKTMIMEKFRREHPPLFDSAAAVERTRVLATCSWPGKLSAGFTPPES